MARPLFARRNGTECVGDAQADYGRHEQNDHAGRNSRGITENDARGVWAMGHAGPSLIAHYGSGGDDDGPNYCDPRGDDVYSDVCSLTGGLCLSTGGNPLSQAECMGCYGGNEFDEQTVRSKHPGGAYVAMADGSVQWVSDDIETTGCYGQCCTAWDYMIAQRRPRQTGPAQ